MTPTHDFRLTSNVRDERREYVAMVKKGAACTDLRGLTVFFQFGLNGRHGSAVIKDLLVRVVKDAYGTSAERIVYVTEGDFCEYIDCYPGPSFCRIAGSDELQKVTGRQYIFHKDDIQRHLANPLAYEVF